MIEQLEGTRETVHFENGVVTRLHDNVEVEDYPMHWHLPIEIVMPVKNSYRVRCGKTLYKLREEDILFIQPGVLHECFAPDSGRRFFCQVSLPTPLISVTTGLAMSLSLPTVMLITPELDGELHAYVRDLLYKTYQKDTTGSLLMDFTRYLYILQIIHSVYSFFEKNVAAGDALEVEKIKNIPLLQQACTYILESYAEPITLDAISRKIGFSKYHFARLFKAYTGETFYRYLNTVRMSNAQIMLTDPDMSVTDIAYAVGYLSMSSFIRMFKDMYGCTPSDYRKMMESKEIYG